jgi:hypothetical protein
VSDQCTSCCVASFFWLHQSGRGLFLCVLQILRACACLCARACVSTMSTTESVRLSVYVCVRVRVRVRVCGEAVSKARK